MFQSQPLSFFEAEQACQVASGTSDGHLVQISNEKELRLIQRLCRHKIAQFSGCCIGLRDSKL